MRDAIQPHITTGGFIMTSTQTVHNIHQPLTSPWIDHQWLPGGEVGAGLKEMDLLPNHGRFPKLFQNIFILKSHKRMFSET